MNWGKALAVGMVVFIAFIVAMGVMMFRSTDALEEDNYYEKGLQHDEMYERLQNNRNLPGNVEVAFSADGKELQINFPRVPLPLRAEIALIKPDDKRQDKKALIEIAEGGSLNRMIEVEQLSSGMWQVQMNWQSADKKYYFETRLFKEK